MQLIDTRVVSAEQSGMKLRVYAAVCFIHIPKKGIRKRIQSGHIKLDGQTVASNTEVRSGQEVTLWSEDQRGAKFDYPLEILYVDDYMAVINKPSGLLVSGNAHRTVQRALGSIMPSTHLADALDIARPVHRLDKGTSGVLIVARTASALRILSRQFENQQIQKKYEAIVTGHVSSDGNIKEPVDGKPSETNYHCIQKYAKNSGILFSHVEIRPRTGRRHQIRVHMSSLGHPILGDGLYGESSIDARRLMLHATCIKLSHPDDGRPCTFTAALPAVFLRMLE